jgi:hypothetical protein
VSDRAKQLVLPKSERGIHNFCHFILVTIFCNSLSRLPS